MKPKNYLVRLWAVITAVLLQPFLALAGVKTGTSRLGRGGSLLDNSATRSPAQYDWSATAGSITWATGSNWVGGVSPIAGDTARFNQTSYTNTPNTGTASIAGIVIGDGSTAAINPAIAGTALTITGATGVDMKAAALAATMTTPITLGASQTWSNASANSLTASGIVSGSGFGLTKTGTGTLVLSGANTFTGGLTISAGVLNLQNTAAIGVPSGASSVAASSALQIQGGIAIGNYPITISGTGISVDGAIRGISGTNSYAGLLTFGATTRINNDAGTLTLSNAGTITGSGFDCMFGGAGNIVLNSIIGTGAGAIGKDGNGTLTLAGANTFTGSTSINAGILVATNANSFGTTAGGVTTSTGAQLQLSGGVTIGAEALTQTGSGVSTTGALRSVVGNNTWGGSITQGGASRIQCDQDTLTINGTISGASTLTFAGNGNITMVGAWNSSSPTTIKLGTGTLTLKNTNTTTGGWTNSGTGTILVDWGAGGSVSSTGGWTLGAASSSTNPSGGGNVTFDNTTSVGAKSQTLATVSTASGACDSTLKIVRTSAQSCTVSISTLSQNTSATSVGALLNFAVSDVAGGGVNGTDFKFTAGGTGQAANTLITNQRALWQGQTLAFYDTSSFVRGIQYGVDATSNTSGTTATLGATDHQQITGNITGQNTVTIGSTGQGGGGTLEIVGATNYTLASAAQVSFTTSTTTNSVGLSGIIKNGGGTSTISGAGGAKLSFGGTATFRTDQASDVIYTTCQWIGGVRTSKSGPGVLRYGGSGISHTQVATILAIHGGTVELADSAQWSAGSTSATPTIAPGATLLFTTSANQTMSGIASGGGGITVNGTGNITLSGINTYTGPTTIGGGGSLTFTAANTGISEVTASGGTCAGATTTGASATLPGNVTIANTSGSVLRPGSFGNNTLNIGGNLTFSGSTAAMQTDSTTTAISQVVVTGTCALGGCTINAPAGITTNGTYPIITSTGAMTGTIPTLGTNSTGHTITFTQVGNVLNEVVAP